MVKNGLVVVHLLANYRCLFCRIQGWWSRLPFLWYSFKVVLTKLYVIHPHNSDKPCDDQHNLYVLLSCDPVLMFGFLFAGWWFCQSKWYVLCCYIAFFYELFL